jgi:hypothetical protein
MTVMMTLIFTCLRRPMGRAERMATAACCPAWSLAAKMTTWSGIVSAGVLLAALMMTVSMRTRMIST